MTPLTPTAIDPVKRITPLAWLTAAAMAVLLLVAFRVPILWMIDRWAAPESYYSHGFLVPLVTLWLVWRDRARLAELNGPGSWLGLGVMLLGLLVLLVSGVLVIFFTSVFGMILVIWGLCGFLFGRRAMTRLIFPMFVLTFMAPLPLATIDWVSLKMKLAVALISLKLLGAIGILAINDGSTIYLGDAVVTVGNACSGLRSLISLIFLGVLFAYVSPLSFPRRCVLFLSSIPIALAANVVRVFALCLIAYWRGEQAIRGAVHDTSGYLIFVVAFILLYAVARLLGMERSSAPPAEPPAGEGAADA
jgi:exosortase